jgi:hypothetical protein
MDMDDAILRHCLRHVRFVTGTSYAGKSTLVTRLAGISLPLSPGLYGLAGRHVGRGRPVRGGAVLQLPRDRLILADTNLPLETLGRIAGYHQIAVMLAPSGMAERRFFDRSDPEKQFMLAQLRQMPDPGAALANFRDCIAAINSPERTAALANAGFYTYVRPEGEADTRAAVDAALARHFGLSGPPQPELRTARLLLRPLRREEARQAQALFPRLPPCPQTVGMQPIRTQQRDARWPPRGWRTGGGSASRPYGTATAEGPVLYRYRVG